jgi:hypothetical protein
VYQADFQDDKSVIEVKCGISALRDFRDGLVRLAQILAESPAKRGYLVLADPKVGAASLDRERRRFRSALRPEVAERLHVVLAADGEMERRPADIPPDVWELLGQELSTVAACRASLPRPQMQTEVLRVLLYQWFAGSGPLTSGWLAETVGCSYRTVAAALAALGPAVVRTRDRSVKLACFPREAWRDLVAATRTARSTVLYVDHSGQPRSPEHLALRVQQVMRPDLAIGGVLGALRHCPSLDIVGAPRLDVCVHAPEASVEPLPVERLDPGLAETGDPRASVRLAVHYLRRRTSFFDDAGNGVRWADPVECLLDLHEARLDQQAQQFLEHLESRRLEISTHGR